MFPFCVAWQPTDRFRADAHCLDAARRTLGWKLAYMADLMGLSEKQLCRQLAGIDPLNHGRLCNLPDDFHQIYDKYKAGLRGAAVLERPDLEMVRGFARLGAKRMARMFPHVTEKAQAS